MNSNENDDDDENEFLAHAGARGRDRNKSWYYPDGDARHAAAVNLPHSTWAEGELDSLIAALMPWLAPMVGEERAVREAAAFRRHPMVTRCPRDWFWCAVKLTREAWERGGVGSPIGRVRWLLAHWHDERSGPTPQELERAAAIADPATGKAPPPPPKLSEAERERQADLEAARKRIAAMKAAQARSEAS